MTVSSWFSIALSHRELLTVFNSGAWEAVLNNAYVASHDCSHKYRDDAVQAAFAGSMLGGNDHSVMFHELTGKGLVLLGGAQILSLIFFRGRLAYPRSLLFSSIGILIAEVIEFSLGHFQRVAIHVPLGVAIFGGAVRQMVWVMRQKPENAERTIS